MRESIECRECGGHFEQLAVHLRKQHGLSVAEYKERFGADAPTVSEKASQAMARGQKFRAARRKSVAPPSGAPASSGTAPVLVVDERAAVQPSIDELLADPGHKPLTFGSVTLPVLPAVDGVAHLIPVYDDKYEHDHELLAQLALSLRLDDGCLLSGETGCGKTSMVYQAAAILNWPVIRVNMDGQYRKSEFVGEKNLTVDAQTGQAVTQFVDSVLPEAMKKGAILLIDEIDAAPAPILFVLQRVLEKAMVKDPVTGAVRQGRQLLLGGDNGRLITAHPNFRIVATSNTLGRGDDSGMYAGVQVMNEATLDRFGTVLGVKYLPRDAEARVIAAKGPVPKDLAQKMVDVARMVRKEFKEEGCYTTFGTRKLISWAEKVQYLGVWGAADVAVLNRLSAEDREFVGSVLQRYLGDR